MRPPRPLSYLEGVNFQQETSYHGYVHSAPKNFRRQKLHDLHGQFAVVLSCTPCTLSSYDFLKGEDLMYYIYLVSSNQLQNW